jgi:ribonuclease E
VPIASYLLNEKRAAVSAIETRQADVRVIIVPNDQMETPHYSVLRVRKGEETSTLSYLLPKLHEEEMAMPSDEEPAERKLPEQPALAAFVMPDAPPAPTQEEPAKATATVTPASSTPKSAVPAQPGLIARFFSALKDMFSGEEVTKPAEVQVEKKAEEKSERQQDRRKPRSNNRRDRNDRRDNRDNRAENSEGRESREDNRRNRREKQQNAEPRETRQTTVEDSEKGKARDEQQPRRERNRRRNDDKRQVQQEAKAQTREEPVVQDSEQEERVQTMPRRKPRQLQQKIRIESAAEQVVEPVAVAQVTEAPAIQPETAAPRTELAKVDLPAVVETTAEHDDNSEARESNGMPRRSRRSPRHLRVSGQRRRRYRDERYPTQSPMPLAVACASPEMASGKVWIRYPVVRPQDQLQEEAKVKVQEFSTAAVESAITPVAAAEPVVSEVIVPAVAEESAVEPVAISEPVAVISEPEVPVVETTHPEAIATPVDEQPQLIAQADEAVAEEVVTEAVEVVAKEVVEPAATVAVSESVAAEEAMAMIEKAPVVSTPVVEPAAEPVVEAKPAATAVVVVANRHATAPMTRAPAPDYVPETPRQSEWVRPSFDFDGKGSAGGHSATHKATAGPTRPQSVE